MIESFEARGNWWLPGDAEHAVTGTLTFDPRQGATLALIGAMRDWRERGTPLPDGNGVSYSSEDLTRSGTYPRILGQADSAAFTLENCFQTNLSTVFGGTKSGERETIFANQVLRGAWFEENEPLAATGVLVRFKHLAHWVRESGLAVIYAIPDEDGQWPDGQWAAQHANSIEDRTIQAANGNTISLGQSLGSSGDRVLEATLTQDFFIRVDGEQKQSLTDLIETASGVQDLVAIAVGKPAAYNSVTFFHPDVQRRVGHERYSPDAIEYFVRWSDADDDTEPGAIRVHEMLFTLPDIGGLGGVERWCEAVATHRSGLSRVMASRDRQGMYVSDRLLNRTAALEAFDRTRTGVANSKFKTRMLRCVEFAGPPFTALVPDPATWAEVLRNERDDAAHHFDRRILDGEGTYFVGESVYWLYVLCMLRTADAPEMLFERMEKHETFRWLSDRLAGILD